MLKIFFSTRLLGLLSCRNIRKIFGMFTSGGEDLSSVVDGVRISSRRTLLGRHFLKKSKNQITRVGI